MNNDDWLHNLANSLDADFPTNQHSGSSSENHNAWTQETVNNDSHSLSLSPHHHFDLNHPHGIVIGNPIEEMNHWHQQISNDACGIAAQQNAIEHLNHQSFSQEQLLHHAQEQHWYSPNIGTSAEDFGKLITEQTHVSVEHHYGGTLSEIAHKLNNHDEVFVGVNSTIEWLPDHNSLLGQTAPDLFDPRHYQGAEANHIVQVIGLEIDPLNPDNSYVIVNDSLSPDGKAMEIPIDQFQEAMKASDGYIATTEIHHSSKHQDHEMTFRGCDDYGFDGDRQNFYVNGHLRGHCEGRKLYTGNYYSAGNTYKGRVGTDMNIYDVNDVKVGYLDSCGHVHKNDGAIAVTGSNHSGFSNAAYYLLDLVG